MDKKNWIVGIFGGMAVFLYVMFSEGTGNPFIFKRNAAIFIGILEKNPIFIPIALVMGLFVGIIFWFIKSFDKKESEQDWVKKSIIIIITLFIFLFLLINIIDKVVNK